ncbi:MAG: 4-(cytidine 5'-diphospho)-2-C-methyl-D-erythritol kinase [Streptosporangiales bacterium]|nr:4-(cytidine 5'-diphospho)-2-C-methyl-D-erythritol kinase [Streptosporangiales bacterium]
MSSVIVRTPAKVNLHLGVGDVRSDRFHELVNVFQAVSLTDDLTARAPDDEGGVTLDVTGEYVRGVPHDRRNLAVRAAHALAEHAGVPAEVALQLRKQIPVAGGMAGGSADAAAALVACDALWGTRASREELQAVAATLGADVPFALVGGTAVGRGIGEQLTPALARGEFHWVFAVASTGLSTVKVYAEFDRLRNGSRAASPDADHPVEPDTLMSALASGDEVALGRALHNDLQPAAVSLRPTLRRTLAAGRELGAIGALVSGSGPTCAFLAHSADHAVDLAVELASAGVCRVVRRARGPVPGARVVDAAAA